MREKSRLILAAALASAAAFPSALLADVGTLVAETPSPCVYAADTRPSPRAITAAEEFAAITGGTKKSSWRQGETVTLTAPDGTETTLANAAATSWSGALPFDAGGLWSASNSRQGSASFIVRHSFFGTLGDGTAASPAKLVDADELLDYHAGDGYVFTLTINEDALLDALKLPAGCGMAKADGDTWRLMSSPDGLVFSGEAMSYAADSRLPGPDRKLKKGNATSVAYSCDNWARAFENASSLTVTTPSGAATVHAPIGTGVLPVRFNEAGTWTVSLQDAARTLLANITVNDAGFILFVR